MTLRTTRSLGMPLKEAVALALLDWWTLAFLVGTGAFGALCTAGKLRLARRQAGA